MWLTNIVQVILNCQPIKIYKGSIMLYTIYVYIIDECLDTETLQFVNELPTDKNILRFYHVVKTQHDMIYVVSIDLAVKVESFNLEKSEKPDKRVQKPKTYMLLKGICLILSLITIM